MKTRPVKGKRRLVSKPRTRRRLAGAVVKAIAQLQGWLSGKAEITLILSRSTHTIHHKGHILSEVSEVFRFVSDSGVVFYLTPSEWTHVSLEHVPDHVDSIHVKTSGSRDAELTVSHWHKEEDRLTPAAAMEQLRQWAKEETALVYASGNKICRNAFVGRLVGPFDDGSFVIKSLDDRAYGGLDPNKAARVVLRRKKDSIGVSLYFGDDIAYVLQTDEIPDPLAAMRSFSKMIQ